MKLFTCLLVVLPTLALGQASFDCKKASTAVEKAICADDFLQSLDVVMGTVYAHALKESPSLKESQKKWLSSRPSDADKLTQSYLDRLRHILGGVKNLDQMALEFLAANDAQISKWSKQSEMYDAMDGSVGVALSLFMEAYAAHNKLGNIKAEGGEVFEDSNYYMPTLNSTAVYKLQSGDYVIFYCKRMALHNGVFSAWLLKAGAQKFAPTLLSIPLYEKTQKAIIPQDQMNGFVALMADDLFVFHEKGAGYGGFSTDRFLKLVDGQFQLQKQAATRDNFDEKYELKGTDDDWVVVYERGKK